MAGPVAPTPATAVDGIAVGHAVREAAQRLGAAGIESPRLDAWLLAAHATGADTNRLRLHPETPLTSPQQACFDRLIERRVVERVPVSRLVGEREFWSLPFALSPATLDPRPDSETVIEAALDQIDAQVGGRSAALRVLDLGTGSGCLLLALLHELPGAWGLGTDRSAEAVATARANAARLGMDGRAHFAVADWAAPLAGGFDIVMSNPPYIARASLPHLAPEVLRHDPALALDGGLDGLDAYRTIVAALAHLLTPAGIALLEIGHDQAEDVGAIVGGAGLRQVELRRDLAGRARCFVAGRPA